MKAAVYYETGPPEVLRYEDVPDPEVYEGGVVIDVEADQHRGRRHAEPRRRRDARRRRTSSATSARARSARSARASPTATSVSGSSRPTCGVRTPSSMAVPAMLTWPVPDGADIDAVACVPVAFGTADDCLFEFGRLQAGRDGADPGRRGRGRASPRSSSRSVPARRSSPPRRATTGWRALRDLGLDHGVDYSRDDWVDRVRDDHRRAGASTSSSTRSAAGPRGQRAVPRVPGTVHHGRQRRAAIRSRSTLGMLVDGQPVAHRRVPRRRDRDRPRAGDDRPPDRRRRRRPPARRDRPDVPARRSGRRARLPREPPGRRPGAC